MVQPALSGVAGQGRLRSTIRHFIVPGRRLLVAETVSAMPGARYPVRVPDNRGFGQSVLAWLPPWASL